MSKITVSQYHQLRFNDGETQITTFPFKNETLWAVDQPCIEIDSEKHGTLALEFQKDGTIQLTYWNPRMNGLKDSQPVFPARLTLQ